MTEEELPAELLAQIRAITEGPCPSAEELEEMLEEIVQDELDRHYAAMVGIEDELDED